jgi:hypothetical protein
MTNPNEISASAVRTGDPGALVGKNVRSKASWTWGQILVHEWLVIHNRPPGTTAQSNCAGCCVTLTLSSKCGAKRTEQPSWRTTDAVWQAVEGAGSSRFSAASPYGQMEAARGAPLAKLNRR